MGCGRWGRIQTTCKWWACRLAPRHKKNRTMACTRPARKSRSLVCTRVCIRVCIPACIPACTPVYTRVCILVCIPVYTRVYTLVCILVCIPACTPVCTPVCIRVCIPACIPVYTRVYTPACILVCIPACIPACTLACNRACNQPCSFRDCSPNNVLHVLRSYLPTLPEIIGPNQWNHDEKGKKSTSTYLGAEVSGFCLFETRNVMVGIATIETKFVFVFSGYVGILEIAMQLVGVRTLRFNFVGHN